MGTRTTKAAKSGRKTQKQATVRFAFEKETPGALRFRETNGNGKPAEQKDALVGTLYVRKDKASKLFGKTTPKAIEVVLKPSA